MAVDRIAAMYGVRVFVRFHGSATVEEILDQSRGEEREAISRSIERLLDLGELRWNDQGRLEIPDDPR